MSASFEFLTAASSLVVAGVFALPMAAQEEGEASFLDSLQVTEAQANTYTFSAQEDPSIAIDAQGRILATWSSRRQELGNYGVFAQLLDPLGRPLGTEMHVNQTLPGAQLDSYAAFAPDGTAWIVWSSWDRRTENHGIFLRQLAETAAGFAPVGDEIFAGGEMQEMYTDPALAVNAEGELLLVWVKSELERIVVEARRFTADGKPMGESFPLGTFEGNCQERMPDVVATPAGGFVVVYQRATDEGVPLGLFARRMDAAGALSAEFAVNDIPSFQNVEPSIDIDAAGRWTVAWMCAAMDSAEYHVRARRFEAEGKPLGGSFAVDAGGQGYRTGATTVAASDGRFLVAYNDHAGTYVKDDGKPARMVNIRAMAFDAAGQPLGESFLVNKEAQGSHAMQVARNGRHAAWSDAGPLAFAWGGRSTGDGSGIAVRIFTPAGFDVPAADPGEPVAACADLVHGDMQRTAPPDPLPDWRRKLPRKPTSNARAGGFIGHDQTVWSPPDPDLAVGPDMIISQVNMEIAAFDKSGTELWRINNNDDGSNPSFYSSLGCEDFVFDPVSTYDWHSNRFIVANSELASDGDYVTFAVSKDNHPDDANDWWKYRVKVSPTCAFPDFPNLGVSRDHISITTDCFSGGGNRVMIFDKAGAMSGTLGTWWNQQMDSNLQSLGNTKNYDSGNAFMYFVSAGFGSGNSLRIQCKRTPTLAYDTFSLPVTFFDYPTDAPQQGSSNRLATIDDRIKNGVVRNGKLYCAHGIGAGGVTKVRWYEIDLRGWPTSGNNPLLLQEGELNLGAGIYSWFPDICADATGNITVSYNRSASSEPASIEASFQLVGDPAGTMQAPISLISSSAPYTGGRYGDYAGVEQDPASPNTYWSHLEYSTGPWETWVGTWDVGSGGADPLANFSASPTAGDEDLLVAFTDSSTGTGLSAWSWDFGDGNNSALQNPSHLYVDPGTYTVSLDVTGTNGSDNETKVGYIVVNNVFDATATPYNGSGVNPNIFLSTTLPILGTNWKSQINGGAVGASGLSFVVVYSGPISGIFTAFGELLIDTTTPWQFTSISGGSAGISNHSISVPSDPVLAGFHSYAQGFLNNVGGSSLLTNAYHLELGY